MVFVTVELMCPTASAIRSVSTPESDSTDTNVYRCSRGVRLPRIASDLLSCGGTGFASAHVRVAVVGRGHEELLDRAGGHPPGQVEDRAGLVVGAARPRTAARLLGDPRRWR